jgi:hypothetical protein
MTKKVHLERLEHGWVLRRNGQALMRYLHERQALDSAWALAKSLGTWLLLTDERSGPRSRSVPWRRRSPSRDDR